MTTVWFSSSIMKWPTIQYCIEPLSIGRWYLNFANCQKPLAKLWRRPWLQTEKLRNLSNLCEILINHIVLKHSCKYKTNLSPYLLGSIGIPISCSCLNLQHHFTAIELWNICYLIMNQSHIILLSLISR